MSAQDNLTLLRRMLEAFGSGDMDGVTAQISPNAVWHIAGTSKLSGDHKGHDGILAMIGSLVEMTGGTLTFKPHDMAASDEHIFLLAHAEAEVDGKKGVYDEIAVWHVEDGLLGERWVTFQDVEAFNRLFS